MNPAQAYGAQVMEKRHPSVGRWLFLLVFVLPAAVVQPNRADAASPDTYGWWWQANTAAVMSGPALVPATDVPPDGMLIQGGPGSTSGQNDSCDSVVTSPSSACMAYAAVEFALPTGATPTQLTLEVSAQAHSTSGTTLEMCPLVNSTLKPEQGGPVGDGPHFGCAPDVTAATSTDGSTYKFDVAYLGSGGRLAVAILATAPTDRVVLDRPDSSSLQIVRSSSAEPSGPSDTPAGGSTGALPPGPSDTSVGRSTGVLPSTPVSSIQPASDATSAPTANSAVAGDNRLSPAISAGPIMAPAPSSNTGKDVQAKIKVASRIRPSTDVSVVYLVLLLAAGALTLSSIIFNHLGVKALWTS